MNRSRLLLSIGLPALAVSLVTLAFVPLAQTRPASEPAAAGAPAADANGNYTLDALHCSTVFRIKHNNVAWFYGRFNAMAGEFTLDTAHPEQSWILLTINTSSVDTNNPKRDQHVMSPDFLNAAEFPEMSFESDKVARGKDGLLEVSGKLTLHGVTRPLTVKVEQTGSGPGLGPNAPLTVGLDTTFTIKRSDYGMSEMLDVLGDEILVTIAIEGAQVR